MTESDVRNTFVDFLTAEKGYPNRSINFEIPIGDQISNRRFLDLALIDPEDKEILAIIELHGNDNPAVVRKAFRRLNEAKSIPPLLNKNVLGFVVVPSDDDFSIFRATYTEKNIGFVNVTKDEFPNFFDLTFKAQIQERIKQDTEDALILENEKRKKRLTDNAIYPITVAIIGALLTIVTTYFDLNKERETIGKFSNSDSLQITKIIDSYVRNNRNSTAVDSISNEDVHNLDEKNIEKRLYINVEKRLHSGVEGRLKKLEDMLAKEPEKTLSILELKSQLSELKAQIDGRNSLYDEKVTSLKEKTDLLSNITSGLALTVIATLVAGLIAAYQAIKK